MIRSKENNTIHNWEELLKLDSYLKRENVLSCIPLVESRLPITKNQNSYFKFSISQVQRQKMIVPMCTSRKVCIGKRVAISPTCDHHIISITIL